MGKKKKGEKDMEKLKYLKNTPLLAFHGQNQLNSDAKLLSAKLHESIIRSHFISILQIYCRDALSYFHSKKHSHYNPPPFLKDFNSFPYAHDAAAWHTKSLVQMWCFFKEAKMLSSVFDLQTHKNYKIYTLKS